MGKWDELQSSLSRLLTNRKASSGNRPSDAGIALAPHAPKVADAVRSIGAQISEEYFTDPCRRDKIGRVLSSLGKFAVDSAVNESLKSVTGGIKVYKIIKEGLKDQPNSHPDNGIKKQDLMVAVEDMQAKMEKMQEDMNKLKQQNETCADYSKGLEPLQGFPGEPKESSASPESTRKKVFIRSRL